MMTASKSAITLVEAARQVSFQPAASTVSTTRRDVPFSAR